MGPIERQYLAATIESATPAKLILILYDHLLAALRRARAEIDAKNVPEAHRMIVKAQEIVVFLSGSLNLGAGDVAQNLAGLYDFMIDQLVKGNLRKDPLLLKHVEDVVQPIRDAWEMGVVLGKPAPAAELHAAFPAA